MNDIEWQEFKKKRFRVVSEFLDGQTIRTQVDQSFYRQDMLRQAMEVDLYGQTIATRDVVYAFPRPTFLDWLFRRPRKVTLHVEAEDLLSNPKSALPDQQVLRIYHVKPIPFPGVETKQ